jgi:hypothetical protein
MSGNLVIDAQDGTISSHGYTGLILGNNIPNGTDKNSEGVLRLFGSGTKHTDVTAPNSTDTRYIGFPDKSGTVALTSDVDTKVSKSGDTMSGNLTIDTQNGSASGLGYSIAILGNSTAYGTDKNSEGVVRLYGTDSTATDITATSTVQRYINFPDKNGTVALTSDITALNPAILVGDLDIKNTPDNTSVDTSTFTVTKRGRYLVVFSVGHAGADSMTQAGAHWLASIRNSNNSDIYPDSGGRNAIVMPLGKQWDKCITATQIYNFNTGTYHAHFHNFTGIGTSAAYASRYSVKAYYMFNV